MSQGIWIYQVGRCIHQECLVCDAEAPVCHAGSPAGVKNGFSYVLAPQGVRPGDTITSGPTSAIHPGNTLPLSAMPIGQQVLCALCIKEFLLHVPGYMWICRRFKFVVSESCSQYP